MIRKINFAEIKRRREAFINNYTNARIRRANNFPASEDESKASNLVLIDALKDSAEDKSDVVTLTDRVKKKT